MEITIRGQSLNLTGLVCAVALINQDETPLPVDLSPLTEALKSKSDQPIYIKIQLSSTYDSLFTNKLGFLDEKEEFQVDKEKVVFPTASYVSGNWENWIYQKGKLPLSVNEIPKINGAHNSSVMEDETIGQGSARTSRLEILLGEEVIQHFLRTNSSLRYLQAASLLKKDVSPEIKGAVVHNLIYKEASLTKDRMGGLSSKDKIKITENLQLVLSYGLDQGSWTAEIEPGIQMNGPLYLQAKCQELGLSRN